MLFFWTLYSSKNLSFFDDYKFQKNNIYMKNKSL